MSLLSLWLPSDMIAAQAALLKDAATVDADVTRCAAAGQIPAGVQSAWANYYAELGTFCHQTPVWLFETSPTDVATTGKRADLLESYQASLFAWKQKLVPLCALSAPIIAPEPKTSFSSLSDTTKYVAIAAGFLATAYVVGQVTMLLPKVGARKSSSRALPARR